MRILIPAYEPNEQLPALVASLQAVAPDLAAVVVDDGSGPEFDGVFVRAEACGAQVLRHTRNRGKGAALKTGFIHIQRTYPDEGVVTADADGQHTVADIIAVAARVCTLNETEGSTMVLGCRAFDGDVPLRSRFGNDVARTLFRAAAGWRLSDTQTGLRGIPASQLAWLSTVAGERFEYEQRALLGLHRAGFSAEEVPIETVYLADNDSSHFRPIRDSVRVILPTLAFVASSLLGFFIDTAALFVLQSLTGALVPSIIAARILSATANFLINRRIVFVQRGRPGMVKQAGAYVLLVAVLLAANVVCISALAGFGAPLWVAKVVTELVLFVLSYRAQRALVFRAAYRSRSIRPTAPADISVRASENTA